LPNFIASKQNVAAVYDRRIILLAQNVAAVYDRRIILLAQCLSLSNDN